MIGRLDADGRRFLATTADGDEETLALLGDGEPVGRRVHARSFEFGDRVTAGDAGTGG
ncbi:hypothetical protein [Streptosporangium sp. OZ121]|uniref:hypothetical protein n=1 Tax=Streptosporangium sp. OZ121 TaxID=3444183 RepID=UPI003F7909B6